MFLTHFNMTQNPFVERPPIEWLLKDERIAQGLARLEYLAQQGLVALLLGQTGVGKSSLLRLFIHALTNNRYNTRYVHLTHLNARGLLRLIVTELGEAPAFGKDRLFTQILERVRKADAATILILDEAHLIAPDALTDLRLLLSSAVEDGPSLKIVLSGQEPLRGLLQAREAGEVAPPQRTPQGIEVFIVCNRWDDQGTQITRDSIENNLFNQRLSMMARRHLRDLRRDAIVEMR